MPSFNYLNYYAMMTASGSSEQGSIEDSKRVETFLEKYVLKWMNEWKRLLAEIKK